MNTLDNVYQQSQPNIFFQWSFLHRMIFSIYRLAILIGRSLLLHNINVDIWNRRLLLTAVVLQVLVATMQTHLTETQKMLVFELHIFSSTYCELYWIETFYHMLMIHTSCFQARKNMKNPYYSAWKNQQKVFLWTFSYLNGNARYCGKCEITTFFKICPTFSFLGKHTYITIFKRLLKREKRGGYKFYPYFILCFFDHDFLVNIQV